MGGSNASGGTLDALFCNAGFGFLRALGQADTADIHRVFDTNVYGVMHTIRAALPLLRQAANGGYIIATSSVGGLVGQPLNEIYCASKFAVEGLLESLATYYKPTFNIDVTLLEPGAIATQFVGTVMEQVNATGGILDDEYKPVVQRYLDGFASRNSVPQTAESVADVVGGAAANGDQAPAHPDLRGRRGVRALQDQPGSDRSGRHAEHTEGSVESIGARRRKGGFACLSCLRPKAKDGSTLARLPLSSLLCCSG
ncbi:SDR family NAD(P)-dependent oxidoreductase [Cohnella rhizosphaerae]|uniref:SDR family NAD(P)-dependent oxidoreductase n=1 Tax=Cohnella rhizosphaerae TaxID=1457232 RepID=A0A9X4QRQ7_9BACL|nr:SDR family NAD(P)-dependent oxidoreductase [Cohnella rhizosphaerae]MDG0809306.1 SDR family NAD(P)-dependent oxidoreductase [Cohnella rhizosphaerae]